MNNWFDHILYNTRSQPETPAVVMEDRVVTYGMLGIAITNCAHRIISANIASDGVVAVIVQNPIRHLTLCLALFRIGVRSMSLESGQPGIAQLKFAAVLGDRESRLLLNPANRFIEVTDAWFGMEPVAGGALPVSFSDYREEFHQALTSGTTGTPKCVGITLATIGQYVVPGVMQFNCSVTLCMLGLSSVWGITMAGAALASRKTLCFATSPFQAIRMIELFSIDFVLASTDQLVSLIRVVRKTGAHVKSLRAVFTGGSVTSRALLEAAAIYLCKDVHCGYGTSEVGSVARATAREVLSHPGFVGYVQPEFEMGIFGPDGGQCRPGQIGIVKGRVKKVGIIRSQRESSEEDRWIDFGDVGWMTTDGRLYVVGRTTDVNIPTFSDPSALQVPLVHEVEDMLRLEWDAADAAAILIDDDAGAARPEIWIGTVDCKDARAEKLEAILRQRGIQETVRIFPMPSIPRGANGKIQRARLKEQMLDSVRKAPFS